MDYPQTFHENIYTYADMVSINHGKHNLRAGVDVRRNIENSNFNVGRPSYTFFDSLFFAADAPYSEVAGVDPGFTGNTSCPPGDQYPALAELGGRRLSFRTIGRSAGD